MDNVVLCARLPCALHPVLVVHSVASPLERATPFLIGILILLVSVVTTHEVIRRAEDYLLKPWSTQELDQFKPHLSPRTYVLGLPWVVDVAQIPALLGTPLAGIFVLKHANFILLYTAVLAVGLMVFFYFLQKVAVNKYRELGLKVLGYRVSLLVIGGIALNLVCAALAAWVVT
jgi:hypothetical protein